MLRIKTIKFYDNLFPKKVELEMYDNENKSDHFNVVCTFNKESLLCQIPKLDVECELVEPEDCGFNYITLCVVGRLLPDIAFDVAHAVTCTFVLADHNEKYAKTCNIITSVGSDKG